MRIMLLSLALLLSFLLNTTSAHQVSEEEPAVSTTVDDVEYSGTCLYKDKHYSEGAWLDVAGTRLICLPKNPHKPNGVLMWLTKEQVDKRQQASR